MKHRVETVFLIGGIMCYEGCGQTIYGALQQQLITLKAKQVLPPSAQLTLDPEPSGLGMHRLLITIEFNTADVRFTEQDALAQSIKQAIEDVGFKTLDPFDHSSPQALDQSHWMNVLANLVAIGVILVLSVLFQPSMILSLVFAAFSFLTTAFTARQYVQACYQGVIHQRFDGMAAMITLGWVLSFAHMLEHLISMPITMGFSMLFMNFMMPLLLMTLVNGMDELKRWVRAASTNLELRRMQTLFPEMAVEYPRVMASDLEDTMVMVHRSAFQKDDIVVVAPGQCFPVDCELLDGVTQVNASLLTGELQQQKGPSEFVPAGAVNLTNTVRARVLKNVYQSTVNQLLFRANRESREAASSDASQSSYRLFSMLYGGLMGAGMAASVVVPWVCGVASASLLLQNITGILFSACPCTMAIAHGLPDLLRLHHLSQKGIVPRKTETVPFDDVHTFVFDKTGTLTTGRSQVQSFNGLSPELWTRLYALEKQHGAGHPLANAIVRYYENRNGLLSQGNPMHEIGDLAYDAKHRGLSATVDGHVVHVGNAAFLQACGIEMMTQNTAHLDQASSGFSPIYVAEDLRHQGVIWVCHEANAEVIEALSQLRQAGKRLVLLTGDNGGSARGFNRQIGSIFDENNLHADQIPAQKEATMQALIQSSQQSPNGFWFIGDGLNDASVARLVSEQGGVSCSMSAQDKSASYTDICLNGSLGYLSIHHALHQFSKKIVWINQGLLLYGSSASLLFFLTFSVMGQAVMPLIPVVIMTSTTLLVLLNSYRVALWIDVALDADPNRWKRAMVRDEAMACLVVLSAVFAAVWLASMGAACLLAASVLLGCAILQDSIEPSSTRRLQPTHASSAHRLFSPPPAPKAVESSREQGLHWQSHGVC